MDLRTLLKKNGLVRDNIIFFITSMALNLIGFFYHAYMGRVLGPTQYSILGVSQTLLYLLNVILNVIQTSIARFISKYKALKDEASMNYLFVHGLSYLFFWGVLSLGLFLLLGVFLTDFLHIPFVVYLYLGLIVPFVYLLALTRGLLQGLQSFISLGLNNISEGAIKLAVGVGLVVFGWGVGGAVLGVTLSYVGAFLFSLYPLRHLFGRPQKKVERKLLIDYSLPVLFVLLTLTALYSFDVLLVKHYLTEHEAGLYAAASLIGKIVFFATLSVAMVMFPKVAESFERKSAVHVKKVLNTSLFFIFLMSLGIFVFYLLFPQFIVLVLFGKNYLEITPILWLFALLYCIFSFIYSLSMYNLSIHRYSFVYFIILMNIVEAGLIVLYHNTLRTVLTVVVSVMAVLLMYLVWYTYSYNLEEKMRSNA